MQTSLSGSRSLWRSPARIAALIAAVVAAASLIVAVVFAQSWLPEAKEFVAWATDREGLASEEEPPEAGHEGHDHAGHDESASIELSPQAWKNLDLKVGRVALQEFERTITVPALLVERPGRTTIQVAAPLNGRVTSVHVAKGQAVNPGDLLFTLRLTHEDLVATQTDYLKTVEALDVEKREIARLERLASGAVAGKVVLEREYEKQKLEGLLRAQHEALLLHGLSEAQVQQISQERRLLRELSVYAPEISNHEEERHFLPRGPAGDEASRSAEDEHDSHPLVVQNLNVHQGDVVEAGAALCDLADLMVLFAEGRGFEQDAEEVVNAANNRWPVKAVFGGAGKRAKIVPGLEIVFVANQVESESRAFHFYAALPNAIARDVQSPSGQRFVAWTYKLGQRLNLLVPVERWSKQIVVPVEAVAQEGIESFVFVRNGGHFDRRPVHVVYRDQYQAVIANDGSIFPGDQVALSSAHQLQMAIKNKAGGAPDPHAGHTH
jgi:multidrug efflux pump subunit AcrA (membrane-fusion protein)